MIERDKKLEFTFHYAKIKTLKQYAQCIPHLRFTFHYAKIKTEFLQNPKIQQPNLHSTMQRLKPSKTKSSWC